MLGDDNNQDMFRQQMRVMLIIMVVMMGYFYLYPPTPPVQQPANSDESITIEKPLEEGRVASPVSTPTQTPDVQAAVVSHPWPNLPAIPTDSNPESDEVVIENDKLRLVFTKIGGRLKQAEVILDVSAKLIPENLLDADTDALYPLGLRFDHSDVQDELDYRRFDAQVSADNRSVVFTLNLPGALQLKKTFSLSDTAHVVDISIDYTNLESAQRQLGRDVDPAYTLNWGPEIESHVVGRNFFKPSVLWNEDGATEPEKLYINKMPEENESPENLNINNVNWIGQRSKYFLAAFQAPNGEPPIDGWVSGTQEKIRFGVKTTRFVVEPQATHHASFQLYLGQMQLASLNEASPTLGYALTFFDYPNFLDWLSKILLRNLNWWNGFVGNYGISIILLTLLVRVGLFPLTFKSMKSMKAMQSIQPEIAELKEKFGDDQQGFAKAQMDMFRERGVNPLGGCLPMFLQMPIFISLYRMIMNSFEIRGASFWWIEDLSQPDRLFHLPFMEAIPFLGKYLQHLNILPLLMVVAMVFSMKLTSSTASQNPQQKMMMRIMPIFFGVISYTFSAGLNLYVLTSTLLGIVQQQVINRSKTTDPAPKKKPKSIKDVRKKRKQSFYARAQEQKRKQAKSMKKKKK